MSDDTIRWQAKEIERLQGELQEARDTIALLSNDGDSVWALQLRLGLPPQRARILAAIYRAETYCTYDRIILFAWPGMKDAPPSPEMTIKQQVCHLRRQLGEEAIVTYWGRGYALTDKGRALVAAALDTTQRKGRAA